MLPFIKLFLKKFFCRSLFPRLLEAFGALWLALQFSAFFSDELEKKIQPYWWVFVIAGLAIAIWQATPRLRRGAKLQGQDVRIDLVVGDIFKGHGDIVIGSNTTFDSNVWDGSISNTSVQGLFTIKNFGSQYEVDALLEAELQGREYQTVEKKGKTAQYPIGTVCRVPTKDCSSYWLAIADLNRHGTARSSFEDLQTALPHLWNEVAERGSRQALRVPVLGSGFSRIKEPRERIVKEIVRSFIAACSECTFCEHLMIYIHPKDFEKHKIDIDDLERFLLYQCEYIEVASPATLGGGTGIS